MDISSIDSSDFFRCLICRECVEVKRVRSEQYDPEYVVFCSCGLSFAPGASLKQELLRLWNKGLIRNVEYVYQPFSIKVWLKQIFVNSTQPNK
jgi:hypothetical protein